MGFGVIILLLHHFVCVGLVLILFVTDAMIFIWVDSDVLMEIAKMWWRSVILYYVYTCLVCFICFLVLLTGAVGFNWS